MDYLIEATDYLRRNVRLTRGPISKRKLRSTPDSLREDLALACSTLNRLIEDEQFFEALANTEEQRAQAVQIFENFCEEFIRRDRALLRAAGMSPDTARILVRDPETLKSLAKQEMPDINTLRNRISDFAYSVCTEGERMEGEASRSNLALSSFEVIGGASVVTVNTAGSLVLGPFAIASNIAGGGMVVDGLKRSGFWWK